MCIVGDAVLLVDADASYPIQSQAVSVFPQPINQQTCLTTVLNYTVPWSNIPADCQPLPPATNVYGLTTSE